MSAPRRVRAAHGDDWDQLQLRPTWSEQQQYKLIRPIVLFDLTPAERAEQTGTASRTLARQADRFVLTMRVILIDHALTILRASNSSPHIVSWTGSWPRGTESLCSPCSFP